MRIQQSHPTFNPTRFEVPYGIGLLDDLHNILPEVLYDTSAFHTSSLVNLIQSRIERLFPEDYVRQRTQYRLFQQDWRRRDMNITSETEHSQHSVFRLGSNSRWDASLHRNSARRDVAEAPPTSPVQRMYYTIPLHTHSTRNTATEGNDLVYALLSTLSPEALNNLGVLSPVPVVPSRDIVNSNTILTAIEPSSDHICTICQSHEQPTENESQWRILRTCRHTFHRACIDEWFARDIHCPVCRHDIRDSDSESSRDAIRL